MQFTVTYCLFGSYAYFSLRNTSTFPTLPLFLSKTKHLQGMNKQDGLVAPGDPFASQDAGNKLPYAS